MGTHDEHIGVGCEALDSFQKVLRRAEPAKMRTEWPSRPQTKCKVVNITLASNDFIAAGLQYAHLFARFCLRDGTSHCFCVHSIRSLLNSGRVAPIVFPLPLLDDNCFSRPRSRCYCDWPISQCREVSSQSVPPDHVIAKRKLQLNCRFGISIGVSAQLSRTMQWWDNIFHFMNILSPTRVVCV